MSNFIVGSVVATVDGSKFKIVDIDTAGHAKYPITARRVGKGSPQSITLSPEGKFQIGEDSGLDVEVFKLEVGKRYKTRDGEGIYEVVSISNTPELNKYPATARRIGKGHPKAITLTLDGVFQVGEETHIDLVAAV